MRRATGRPCLWGIVLLCLFTISNPALAASWVSETFAGMPVDIYVPDTAPALAGKRALMISMGGCGQQAANNTEFRDQSNWESTADAYGMVVAVPRAPGGGVLWAGCWDYYDENHTRTNRHAGPLLQLTEELKGRPSLNIDPDQVYVSGLSSGGGMAMVLACVAPDVFAGIGNSAGPALGTGSGETTQVATTAQAVHNLCRELAGSYASHLNTQVLSIVWGSNDYLAAPGYSTVNAEGMALVYSASADDGSSVVAGVTLDGEETTWSDAQGPRVSKVFIQGLSHAWPAGGGSGASNWMDNTSINYPAHLTQFLFANNRRLSQNDPPRVELGVARSGAALRMAGTASDDDGVAQVEVKVVRVANGRTLEQFRFNELNDANGFGAVTRGLPDGLYYVQATAYDHEGSRGIARRWSFVGDRGGYSAPMLQGTISGSSDCVSVSGEATDTENDLLRIEFRVDGTVVDQMDRPAGGAFSMSVCGLDFGDRKVVLRAVDLTGLSAKMVANVELTPPGVTATLTDHINAGRLQWADYSAYYLRHGLDPFTLYSQGDGSWSDQAP